VPKLKAIETRYRGYRFRSRLEARWAVFMDALGVRWEFEPEGYNLDGEWYLPDFWLPDLRAFLEIKPRCDDLGLSDFSTDETFEFVGDSGDLVRRFSPELAKNYARARRLMFKLARSSGCRGVIGIGGFHHDELEGRIFFEANLERGHFSWAGRDWISPPWSRPGVEVAALQAQQARFEHGEAG
jgi:hypothetical protein